MYTGTFSDRGIRIVLLEIRKPFGYCNLHGKLQVAVTPEMVDAFGRMFLYNWSIDEALGDLSRGGIDPDFVITQRGSNQWAVSPSRTADDGPPTRAARHQRCRQCR